MQSTILITGFEPFLDVTLNPSGEVAQRLDGELLEPIASQGGVIRLVGAVLPVSFERAPGAFSGAVDALGTPPLAVLSLGVHRGNSFRLESRARATFQSIKPDNDGALGGSIALPGPAVRTTSVDLSAAEDWLLEAGAPEVMRSEDAGGYLCERIFRAGLDKGEEGGFSALFLHVPPVEAVPIDAQERIVCEFVRRLAAAISPS